MKEFKIGDKVLIIDYSDCHGEIGKIWEIQNNIYLVEIDCKDKIDSKYTSYIWPVYENEIKLI